MKNKRISLFVLILVAVLIFAGCVPATSEPVGQLESPSAKAEENTLLHEQQLPAETPLVPSGGADSPEGVALRFYSEYVEASQAMRPTLGNPEFDAHKYLSEEYLMQVAEIQAGFEGSGFDPVLQAQAIPPEPVEVKDVRMDGDQANVTLQFGRTVLEQPWERIVSLAKISGEWKIVPDRVEGGALSPETAVQAFYDWYLAYIGEGEQFRNPLSDHAYRAAPYLSSSMVQKVDRMIEEGLIYDPFLCAQDIPAEIKPEASFYNDARPVVVVSSSFPGHTMVVDLSRVNFNQWAIQDITCGNDPAGYVKAFYTWALDYALGSGELHYPLVEGAYQGSGFLSQGLIAELDDLVSSSEPLMADPIFLAQDFPRAFNTEACGEESCALVNMQYNDAMIRQLRVDLVQENGALRIAGVSNPARLESSQPAQELPGVDYWVPFVDEAYGFALSVPSRWQVSTSSVTDLHTPEEYSVMRTSSFVAPVEGSQVVPFRVEVMVGDEEILAYSFPTDEKIADLELNGYAAAVFRSEPGLISYVLRHPLKENVWVVFVDPVTQFPGREELSAAVGEAFEAMLSTVTFVE